MSRLLTGPDRMPEPLRRSVKQRVVAAVLIGAIVWIGAENITTAPRAEAADLSGVDVSRWDHPGGQPIDWPKVKQAGRSFAIIKSSEGTSEVNPYFATDIAQARAAGLIVGAYHYGQPRLPISSAAADARHYIRTVGTFRNSNMLPPILDLECAGIHSCDYGTLLTVSQMKQWTQLWLDTAQKMTGRTPMIYSYHTFWEKRMGDTTQFAKYPFWYARWSSRVPNESILPGGWTRWTFWQYSSTTPTPGLPPRGDVGDVNLFNGSWTALKAFADGSKAIGLASPSRGLAVSAQGRGWAKLTWNAPASNGGAPITDYTVSVNGGAPVVTPSRSFMVLGASGDYSVVVRARTIAGSGESAPLAFTTTEAGAPPPNGSTKVVLSAPNRMKAGTTATVTAKVVRVDTGQAIPNTSLTLKRVPKRSATTSVVMPRTKGDGSTSLNIKVFTHTWIKASSPAQWGTLPSSASRTIGADPWLGVSLSKPTVKRGYVSSINVRTSYLYRGDIVIRQDLVGGRWRDADTRRLNSSGQASFGMQWKSPGSRKFRIVLPSSDAHFSKASGTLTLKVW